MRVSQRIEINGDEGNLDIDKFHRKYSFKKKKRKELEMEMYGEMNGVCKRLRNGKMLTDSILNCPCCENKHQENKL